MKKLIIAAVLLSATSIPMPALALQGPSIEGIDKYCEWDIPGERLNCYFETQSECQQYIAYVRVNEEEGYLPVSPRCVRPSFIPIGYPYLGVFDISA